MDGRSSGCGTSSRQASESSSRGACRITTEVAAALRRYADRGVFRGFSERKVRSGHEFVFTWLTPEPIVLRYDSRRRSLTFKELLPGVARASPLLADVQALVESRTSRALPAHRRIDRRRLAVTCSHRRGAVSVVLVMKGPHRAHAVQKGVNLVHEIFLALHASYPEYPWDAFRLPAE